MFYFSRMDRNIAIEGHRQSLLRVVTDLFARIGLAEGGTVERLSRPLYRFALGILRPAESAVRRLIIVAAHGVVVEPRRVRSAPKAARIPAKETQKRDRDKRRLSFRLFDPPRRLARAYGRPRKRRRLEPRIRVIDVFYPGIPWFLRGQPAPAVPEPTPPAEPVEDDTVDAGPLCRRLAAILDALQDLSRQVKRYALWRDRPIERRRPRRTTPLRVGRPPGFRQRQIHEVDEILAECHYLAQTLPAVNTS